MSFCNRQTSARLRTLGAQISRLTEIEAGLVSKRRADCPEDQHNAALIRAERERLERERERLLGGPRDTATLSLFEVTT